MNNLKHTPGPWKISEKNINDEWYIETVQCVGPLQIFSNLPYWDKDGIRIYENQDKQHEANKLLIKMAPEMLDDIIKDIKPYSGISWNKKNFKSDITHYIKSNSFDKTITEGLKRCLEKIDLIEKATRMKIDEAIK